MPRARIPELIAEIEAIGERHEVRIGTFGHAGDGNLHPTFVFDRDDPRAEEVTEAARADLYRAAIALGGTVTAEHGVGTARRAALAEQVGPDVLRVMRSIKSALDPLGHPQPGQGPVTGGGTDGPRRRPRHERAEGRVGRGRRDGFSPRRGEAYPTEVDPATHAAEQRPGRLVAGTRSGRARRPRRCPGTLVDRGDLRRRPGTDDGPRRVEGRRRPIPRSRGSTADRPPRRRSSSARPVSPAGASGSCPRPAGSSATTRRPRPGRAGTSTPGSGRRFG